MARKKLIPNANQRSLPRRNHPEYESIYMDDYWRPQHEDENHRANRLHQEMSRLSRAIGSDYFIVLCHQVPWSRREISSLLPHIDAFKDITGISPLTFSAMQKAFTPDGKLVFRGPGVLEEDGIWKTLYFIKQGSTKNEFNLHAILVLDKRILSTVNKHDIESIEEMQGEAIWHEINLSISLTESTDTYTRNIKVIFWVPADDLANQFLGVFQLIKRRIQTMCMGFGILPPSDIGVTPQVVYPNLSEASQNKGKGKPRKIIEK